MSPETLRECLKLKAVARAGWTHVGVENPESVAAHSWGMAFLALILCPPELDRERVLALAILHDLPEVRVGDLTPRDGVSKEEKAQRETQAAEALFQSQPELLTLFREYAGQTTPEARFVHALDRLDMGLQAQIYAEAGFDTAEFLTSARAGAGSLAEILSF